MNIRETDDEGCAGWGRSALRVHPAVQAASIELMLCEASEWKRSILPWEEKEEASKKGEVWRRGLTL